MATESILGGISQEESLQQLISENIYVLMQLLNAVPRLDGAGRMLVNTTEVTNTIGSVGSRGLFLDDAPRTIVRSAVGTLYNNIEVI